MKKLFMTMLAAVTLLASCSKEETPGQTNGEESIVTFSLSTSDLATKALGDGKTAQDLYYAVYDADGKIVDAVSLIHGEDVNPDKMDENSQANVSIQLLNGQKYSILFWAESSNSACEIAWDDKIMTYSPKVANQEAYDAFYAYVPEFTVTGDKTETVKMYRPFAQLNIATTEGDLGELGEYKGGVQYKYAKVIVKGVPTSMNLETGATEISDDATKNTVIYGYSEISLTDTDFPVAGAYDYLSMNYVLAGAEKHLVEVVMDIAKDANGTESYPRTFANVPVQRNYRTNIYGDLYASTFNYNVEITPDFDGHYQLLSGVVDLDSDLEVDKTFVVAAGDEAIINLNGNNFVNNSENTDYEVGDGIIVYGKLTIKGEGTVQAPTRVIWARGDTDAEVNIYGGNYIGSQDGNSSAIYASGNGVVNIYGGVYEAKVADKKSFANKTEGVYAALNVYDNKGTINVYGGTFINFDPANPGTEPADWNAAHPNGFVADGYVSVKVAENTYKVVKAVAVSTIAELKSAIENGGEVALAADMAFDVAVVANKDLVLHLNGKKLSTTKGVWIQGVVTALINVQGGANVTISGEGEIDASQHGDYAVEVRGGSTVTILDGKFIASCSAVNVIEGTANIKGGYFEDKSTFEGKYLINCIDDAYRAEKAKVIVTGGSFKNFNPAENTAEGEGTDFVPEGYISAEASCVWTVTEE